MKKILVLHGPNLNLLGQREPSLYGCDSLATLNQTLESHATAEGYSFMAKQSNSESVLIDAIHNAFKEKVDHLIINPAAFTHTSIAMRDALLATNLPFIEVHITNIYARESFRHQSYFSDISVGVISGFGTSGYLLALKAIIEKFKSRES